MKSGRRGAQVSDLKFQIEKRKAEKTKQTENETIQ